MSMLEGLDEEEFNNFLYLIIETILWGILAAGAFCWIFIL